MILWKLSLCVFCYIDSLSNSISLKKRLIKWICIQRVYIAYQNFQDWLMQDGVCVISHMSLKQCEIDSPPTHQFFTKFHWFLFLVGGICCSNCLKILSKVGVTWPVLVSHKHFQLQMETLFHTHFTRRILRKKLFIKDSNIFCFCLLSRDLW